MTIVEEIQSIMRELTGVKPRSRRRNALEDRLCALRMKQLKSEIRSDKRKAK
jgi:hypothetical protein